MPALVALLRGINLAKRRRVAMSDLRALLEEAGYEDVRTHLQSGNVVLTATGSASALGRAIETAFAKRFGFSADVVVRTKAQLDHVVEHDPFGAVADNGSRYFVAFLGKRADKALVGMLESIGPGDDQFAVDGAELYVWCPNGLLDSPLMAALNKYKKGPVTTVRNWNTVRKLATMLD